MTLILIYGIYSFLRITPSGIVFFHNHLLSLKFQFIPFAEHVKTALAAWVVECTQPCNSRDLFKDKRSAQKTGFEGPFFYAFIAVFGIPLLFWFPRSAPYSTYSSKNELNCIYSIIKKHCFEQCFLEGNERKKFGSGLRARRNPNKQASRGRMIRGKRGKKRSARTQRGPARAVSN